MSGSRPSRRLGWGGAVSGSPGAVGCRLPGLQQLIGNQVNSIAIYLTCIEIFADRKSRAPTVHPLEPISTLLLPSPDPQSTYFPARLTSAARSRRYAPRACSRPRYVGAPIHSLYLKKEGAVQAVQVSRTQAPCGFIETCSPSGCRPSPSSWLDDPCRHSGTPPARTGPMPLTVCRSARACNRGARPIPSDLPGATFRHSQPAADRLPSRSIWWAAVCLIAPEINSTIRAAHR
jgi:hypothetical protein